MADHLSLEEEEIVVRYKINHNLVKITTDHKGVTGEIYTLLVTICSTGMTMMRYQ